MTVIFLLALCTQVAGTTQQARIGQADLALEASVTMGGRKVVPIRPFWILDEDFGAWLRKSQHVTLQWFWNFREWAWLVSDNKEAKKTVQQLADCEAFLKAHTVATETTDVDGKALFRIPPGRYFLVGALRRDRETFCWNLPVDVKPGANRVILDLTNVAK